MKNIKGIAYALISSSTFGLIPLFSIPVLASGAMGVPSLLFYRFAFATAAIAVAGLALKRNFKIKPAVLVKVSVLGIFYASTSMGLTMSYQYISSGAATTIHFLYPILVTAIMIAFFRRKSLAHADSGIRIVHHRRSPAQPRRGRRSRTERAAAGADDRRDIRHIHSRCK